MSYLLKPSQLRTVLMAAIKMREPVVIKGKPGIGKTQITQQVAAALGYDVILSHPALDDPTDGKGLPWFNGKTGGAQLVPFGQLAKVLVANHPTVWFLDDFGQAPDAVQKTYMQWLHGGECAGHVIPDAVSIVIATNDRTHRAGVGGMLEPVKSRTTIVELVEDLGEWSEWLFSQTEIEGVPLSVDLVAETVAFLRSFPDHFCKFAPSADLTNSPLPRGWAKSLKWLAAGLPKQEEVAALAGVVGEGPALERVAFREMYRNIPTIDAILLSPETAIIPDSPSILYAVARGLASRANDQTAGRLATYAGRLVSAEKGEFATLLIRDAIRLHPKVQETPEFVRLTTSEFSDLLGLGSRE